MSIVTCDMAMSVDGYVAGPDQSLEAPLGVGVEQSLHRWMFDDAETNATELEAITAAGAFVMGRNMFGPGRGAWDLDWTGWWGPEPPYHGPVFVLTHHERADLPMQGGTTFHFVTGGVDEAVSRAREAAGGKDVAVAGGASTVDQCLAAGVIDELRLHVAPVLLGRGERLFEGAARTELTPVSARHTPFVTHLTYTVGASWSSSRPGDDAWAQ